MPLAAVVCALAAWLRLSFPSPDFLPDLAALTQHLPTIHDLAGRSVTSSMAQTNASSGSTARWVAPHVETVLWSSPEAAATELAVAHQWSALQIDGRAKGHRLPVLDPSRNLRGWVQAQHVGPVDPALLGTAYLPPVGRPIAWAGPARVTMYTCVELGGCNATASGLWPEPGMVAVDPRVIPLGSTVWIQGVGTFLAADTGSLVRGAHLDIYSLDYYEAINWGVQQRSVLVFAPE
jgi:3D (Asp-Asp-Asp) domain-containing protein